MNDYIAIEGIRAREILDSRGKPTVEAEVFAEGGFVGRASVPSGASTGAFEAFELRDGDLMRYGGAGTLRAVENVNNIISKELLGFNVLSQADIDKAMILKDGTENKSKLGANAILAVSIACAKAAANALGISLYRYLGGVGARRLPVPMMNIINGGKHADNSLSCQEFMIMPVGAKSFSEGLKNCSEVYYALKKLLKSKGYSTGVGDEGGFAPNLSCDEESISLICEAIEAAGFKTYKDFKIALDPASTEMFEEAKNKGEAGKYYFWKTDVMKTREEMVDFWNDWVNKYPVISIEDGMAEEDWEGWRQLTERLGGKIQLVGDDLFVTNSKRIKKGIEFGVANSVLIKVNQIGTVTEAINAVNMAKNAGYKTIASHRSGETEDAFLADFAVALNTGQIKTGAPARSERVAKYNRLLRIEEELKCAAKYSSNETLSKFAEK